MAWSLESGSLDFATLKELYGSRSLKPNDVIRAVYARLDRFEAMSSLPLLHDRRDPPLAMNSPNGWRLYYCQSGEDRK